MEKITLTMPFGEISVSGINDGNYIASEDEDNNSDMYRIFFVKEGSAQIVSISTGERNYIKKGDIISAPAGASVDFIHRNSLGMICISFNEKYLECQLREISESDEFADLFGLGQGRIITCRRSMSDFDRSYFILKDLLKEYELRDTGYQMIINARFAELLIRLARSRASETQMYIKPSPQSVIDAAEYMEHHYTLGITIEDLAERADLSVRHFSRLFLKTYGISPKRFLEHMRLKNAAALLLGTDMTVTEIAAECGFSDSNYFSRIFKKHYLKTPKKYREEVRMVDQILGVN